MKIVIEGEKREGISIIEVIERERGCLDLPMMISNNIGSHYNCFERNI